MIDIHCHILPGVDDGAQHDQAALEMGRAAEKEGITHIIATPHNRTQQFDNDRESIVANVALLNELFHQENVAVMILPGQENRIFGDMVEAIEGGELLTMNDKGQYLFVEFPSNHVPRYTEQLFYDLQNAGVIPVIVHPERNSEIVATPDILYKLIKNGALSQVTAASLIGGFGKKIKKFSQQLFDYNLAHFLASDAHNVMNRAFYLRESFEELENTFGSDMRFMIEENAELFMKGQMVNVAPPSHIKEKKFLGLF